MAPTDAAMLVAALTGDAIAAPLLRLLPTRDGSFVSAISPREEQKESEKKKEVK